SRLPIDPAFAWNNAVRTVLAALTNEPEVLLECRLLSRHVFPAATMCRHECHRDRQCRGWCVYHSRTAMHGGRDWYLFRVAADPSLAHPTTREHSLERLR